MGPKPAKPGAAATLAAGYNPPMTGVREERADQHLIEECLARARALLKRNLTPAGILAATPTARSRAMSYDAVFGRDAGLCAVAMAASGDPQLVAGAVDGVRTLARHQADNGQIPKFVMPESGHADFWYVGCIDAALWWLIAVHHLARRAPAAADLRRELAGAIGKAITWLQCQEHPRLALLAQNEASDWADIMPRSGFVLYSNALWYYVKRLYDLPRARETRHHFNHLFHPFSRDLPEYRRLRLLTHFVRNRMKRTELYLSFVNFAFWGEEGDVLGNLLAVLLGLAGEARAGRIVRALGEARIEQPWPVRVTCTPIGEDSPLWREYMGRHRQNLEHQYHNGGCWPFVGGFWVMALAALGRGEQARAALARLAQANAQGNWNFTEWFHGLSGEPRGMSGQSWNAASFLLAARSLQERVF